MQIGLNMGRMAGSLPPLPPLPQLGQARPQFNQLQLPPQFMGAPPPLPMPGIRNPGQGYPVGRNPQQFQGQGFGSLGGRQWLRQRP